MGRIRIVNLRNYVLNPGEVLVKVDRSSVLGNPFYMKDESMRDEVCDKYLSYFRSNLNDIKFFTKLMELTNLAASNDVALGCWCYPSRCHAETIKKYIEERVMRDV